MTTTTRPRTCTAARWSGDGAWQADDAHGFRLAASDDKVHWLGYRHLLRGQENKPQLITDFMGYNSAEPRNSPSGVNWVGDLILECEARPDQAQGELTLELSKGVDRFQARFDLASGLCTLLRVHDAGTKDEKEEELDHKPTALKGGGKHAVRFADVDQRLTVWVDDALPFGDGVAYRPPSTEGPTEANDLKPAGVGLKGVGGTILGLRLWRDTYYSTAELTSAEPRTPTAGRAPTRTLLTRTRGAACNSPTRPPGAGWTVCPRGPCTCSRGITSAWATTARKAPTVACGDWFLNGCCWAGPLDIYYPFDRFGRIR